MLDGQFADIRYAFDNAVREPECDVIALAQVMQCVHSNVLSVLYDEANDHWDIDGFCS